MRRHERTRVLVDGDRSLARRMAAEVESAHPVEVLDDPREGLVMVKVRESAKRSLFYLGEALMTSCRVRVSGATGLGMVLGDDRALAYDLAVIDAAFSIDGGGFDAARWEDELAREGARIEAERALAQAAADKTRVDFSTMEVEL